jgi:hypothetical protein
VSDIVLPSSQGSFLEGAARIFDFRNTLTRFKQYPTPAAADRAALASDWCAVGNDLRSAMSAVDTK